MFIVTSWPHTLMPQLSMDQKRNAERNHCSSNWPHFRMKDIEIVNSGCDFSCWNMVFKTSYILRLWHVTCHFGLHYYLCTHYWGKWQPCLSDCTPVCYFECKKLLVVQEFNKLCGKGHTIFDQKNNYDGHSLFNFSLLNYSNMLCFKFKPTRDMTIMTSSPKKALAFSK